MKPLKFCAGEPVPELIQLTPPPPSQPRSPVKEIAPLS